MSRRHFRFSVVSYIEDLERGERINVGILVAEAATSHQLQEREAPQIKVRFAQSWERLLFICPNADVDLLEELERAIQDLLAEEVMSFERLLATLHRTILALDLKEIGLSPPKVLLAKDLSMAAEHVMEVYVPAFKLPSLE
jgi:hypothetical protein